MNSQQSQSEIANENFTGLMSDQTPKYIVYNDVKKYQSQQLPRKSHDACLQYSSKWTHQNQLNPMIPTQIKKLNPTQYLIQHQLNKCCLNTKILLKFNLKKYNSIQISKVKHQMLPYPHLQQYDISYVITHVGSILKIQVSITKQKIAKIWKEIQLPIKSYETEVSNILSIKQNKSGDICFVINQFQFMMNMNFAPVEGLMVHVRCDGQIQQIQVEQCKNLEQEVEGGCREGNCSIF